ncbi:MAG: DUF3025 domain-containing protein [Betaproteobacteria bacterium]|nr:DUF3025 domain-containing protein [Pseudomonadota bacterium]NBO11638.1 DUF3025 domain-containing protein [Betaproteobacteria bacterium]NBO43185.1 DUF3025 domain-containing protein [Betaproteobacteria bacterium]NBP09403.1 DUF3025 domain-containing protein [Betaproteobacteria bacterium]NBP60768.1 DUF3025 domain-containing protein [Betaproteobacteria bacterium]
MTALYPPDADRDFLHPWWQPVRADLRSLLALTEPGLQLAWLNEQAQLRACRNGQGKTITFIDQAAWSGAGYEFWIDQHAQVPTRMSGHGRWHDVFNALCWLRWPLAKAQLNRMHAQSAPAQPGTRGPMRDKATLIDEQALIWLPSDPALCEALRAGDWKRLFWAERWRWAQAQHQKRLLVFGHALFEKCLAPYKALTAHVLILSGLERDKPLAADRVDALLAERLSDAIQAGLHHAGLRHDGSQQAGSQQAGSQQAGLKVGSELVLYPLPVLGVPGWHEDNQHQAFYDDPQVFRLTKARASGPSSA